MFVGSARADIPAIELFIEAGPSASFTGTRGWEFGRLGGPNDIWITQLGVYDGGGDGLANSHEVGLWRREDNLSGTLLASATVPAGTDSPLMGGYRWVPIIPVRIPYALDFYMVGAHYVDGDADLLFTPIPVRFAPQVGPLLANGSYSLGPDMTYPNISTIPPSEGQLGERFFQANFQYVLVPEPATWLLLSPAALFFLVRRRIHA